MNSPAVAAAPPQLGKVVPRWGAGSALRRLGLGEPVLLEAVEERLVGQVEQARRAGAVAAGELERLAQRFALVLLPGEPLRRQPEAALAAAPPARRARRGRSSSRTSPPSASSTSRSTTLASSRTLPGQACSISASQHGGGKRACVQAVAARRARAKCSASSGMSSRRSRSGGSASGTTFRR